MRIFPSLKTVFSLFIFTSCISFADYSVIDACLLNHDYNNAVETLKTNSRLLYSPSTDKVLHDLDLGMLEHYAGKYTESNETLTEAEIEMNNLYGSSITDNIGAFLFNDNVMKYDGDDYEDLYVNLFKALNYIKLNNDESAFVEIRRMDNKTKILKNKYADRLYEIDKKNRDSGVITDKMEVTEFYGSALASYLSMLMYRCENDISNAQISRKALEQYIKTQPHIYGKISPPNSLDEELGAIPSGKERLNVVAFTGRSPLKTGEDYYFNVGDRLMKISYPRMKKRGSQVSAVEVYIDGIRHGKLELLESMENVALETFKNKSAVIRGRAVARVTARIIAATIAETTAEREKRKEKKESTNRSLFADLIMTFTAFSSVVSENADIRISRFFPAHAHVGGFNVEPGPHSIRLVFKTHSGRIVHEEKSDYVVQNDGLNLIEGVCLK